MINNNKNNKKKKKIDWIIESLYKYLGQLNVVRASARGGKN